MERVNISDDEGREQVRAILDRMNPEGPFATAIRRVFAAEESPVGAEADSGVAPSAVDTALRSVRLPEATVRKWESEAHEAHTDA